MLFIEINNTEELNMLNKDYLDDVYFTISEGAITTIKNISKINGSLYISNSNFQDFGDIEEINGSLEVSSNCKKITSLGLITKINGDLKLRFSTIKSLSNLMVVNGNVNLKDSNIIDLGYLTDVNGFMYLSKHMKTKLNFENIKVAKQIKFYTEYKSTEKESTLLIKSPKTIIPWESGYIFNYEEINNANNDQKTFYQYFKKTFLDQNYINIENNNSYAFILMFDLTKSLYNSNNKEFEIHLNNLALNYSITNSYVYDNLMRYYDSIKDYDNGLKYYLYRNSINLTVLAKYAHLINRNLFTPDIIVRLTGISVLTTFGKNNIEYIKPFISNLFDNFEKQHKTNFLNIFIDYPVLYKVHKLHPDNNPSFLKGFKPSYYKSFFFSEAEYEYHLKNDLIQIKSNYDRGLTNVVEKAITSQLRKFVVESEDIYRVSIGLPKIGEGWISETELFYKISNTFQLEVKHHGKPKWLGLQHFDIYIPELNLAFEYQGIQHEKPIEYFGGMDGLLKTKKRDEIKRNKCKENGVTLIYVYPDYKFENVKQSIQRRILFNKKTTESVDTP